MENNYNPFDGRGGRTANTATNSNKEIDVEELLGMEKLPKSPFTQKTYTATVEDTSSDTPPEHQVRGREVPTKRIEGKIAPTSREKIPSPRNSYTGQRPPGVHAETINNPTNDRIPSPRNSYTGQRPPQGQVPNVNQQPPFPNQAPQQPQQPKTKRPTIVEQIRDKMTTKDWIALILLLIFFLMLISPHSFKS